MDTIDGTTVTDKLGGQHDETKNVPNPQPENRLARNETAKVNMTRNDLVEHFKLKAFIENNITRHVMFCLIQIVASENMKMSRNGNDMEVHLARD